MLNISELDDFELLVRTHRARLLRLVAFSTGDQDLAETVVQDSLLKPTMLVIIFAETAAWAHGCVPSP